MSNILTISIEKCKRCKLCEKVCPQSAINVIVFKEQKLAVPVMCMHCEDAACMKVCPVNAFSRDENGAVVVDPMKCIGCKMCISACPMGNISFNSEKKKIMKCDLCGGDPMCAKKCPAKAILYVDASTAGLDRKEVVAEKFKDLYVESKAEPIHDKEAI